MKIVKLLVGSVCFVWLAACSRDVEPQMAPLTPIPSTQKVHENWAAQAGVGAGKQYLKLDPVMADNTIYTASAKGVVVAVDAKTGRKLWQVNTKQPLTSGLAAGGGLIYVGTGHAQVLALKQDTGAVAWQAHVTNEVFAAPTYANNILLVKSGDDRLHALNAQTGTPIWNYVQDTPKMMLRGGSSPVISNGYAVAGFSNGQLGVFTANNGELIWKRPIAQPHGASEIEQMVDISGNIILVGNTIYVVTYQGVVAAVDRTSGSILWQHQLSSHAGLALADDRLIVTDSKSHVWALNRYTGQVLWEQDKLFGRHLTAPQAVGSNQVVVADAQGYVHWLSVQDGHLIARHRLPSGVMANPIVVGHNVVLYTNSGRLASLHAS